MEEKKPSPVEERADNGERDSHKPFAALKVSFSLRGAGGRGDVMKNIENNFC